YTFIGLVALYAAAAAAIDARLRRVPNWLTVPTALAGLAFHSFAPNGWGALTALGGFAVGFALLLLPTLMGGAGFGDVKLLAALGAWLGTTYTLYAFVLAMFLAAAIALAMVVYAAVRNGMSSAQDSYMANRQSRDTDGRRRGVRVLPFAVPIALSTWCVLAWIALQQTS
ncbi:MAG: prepilin peptidase, partial [Pirellulales bacterium]|nr:prepilin peptidase [Pirellulales bacterium]